MHYLPHGWAEAAKELATVWATLGVYNVILEALPTPRPEERWYQFLWKVLHGIGLNVSKLRNGGAVRA